MDGRRRVRRRRHQCLQREATSGLPTHARRHSRRHWRRGHRLAPAQLLVLSMSWLCMATST